jgi:ribosomal protein S18 acetylase RimI-like enzyme
MEKKSEMIVVPGDTPQYIPQAVEIFLDAFWLKVEHLELFSPDRELARRVYLGSMDFAHARYALEGDQVLGAAGLEYDGRHFLRLKWAVLRREFGFFGTLGRWLFSWMSTMQRMGRDTMRIAVIAATENARGRGVGTFLLEDTFAFARSQGYKKLKLEVVDTNPRARALYERVGFRTVRRIRTGFITRRGGFGGFDVMEKEL